MIREGIVWKLLRLAMGVPVPAGTGTQRKEGDNGWVVSLFCLFNEASGGWACRPPAGDGTLVVCSQLCAAAVSGDGGHWPAAAVHVTGAAKAARSAVATPMVAAAEAAIHAGEAKAA